LTYDDPPELYAELMEQPWHKPVVGAVFAAGVFTWFIGAITLGSLGGKKD
jgi:hypothetical protein